MCPLNRHTDIKKPNTIDAVAEAAGVSSMTVSRVLRGTDNVSPRTQAKVHAAINELGYVHNRLAGALASSRSPHIAVIVSSVDNIVFSEVLAGISHALEDTGFQPVIGISDYDLERELSLVRSMLEWRPAGFALAHARHDSDTVKLLKNAAIPVVEMMEFTAAPIDMCIGIDHDAAGAAMARHVIAKGYRRFGYLGSDHIIDFTAATRYNSFKRTVEAHGGKIVKAINTERSSGINLGRKHMPALLNNDPGIELVYFSNDAVAAGAMLYCLANGIAVPEQLAMASFSGLEIASAMPAAITTVASPRFAMGQIAAEQLLRRINGENFDFIQDAGFTLVEGASC